MSLLVLLAAILMVTPNAVAEKPVKIGVLVPLTGMVSQGGL